jgi:tRNA pseudouridine55 synthase
VIDGLAVIDKPAGMTSHDVVARCRRIFGQRRVGHAGTLDPDATGVLVVGLGQVTRLLQWVTGLPKSYEGEVVCGLSTSTLDAAGEVTGRWDMSACTLADARRVAATLTGRIDQVPPMVSAIKIGGRRLHELAREGVEVDRPPRRVEVTRFDVGEVVAPEAVPDGGGPVWAITVDCSSGTYVRSLAADLGTGLGGGAHLRNLRRTALGPWTAALATPLDDLGTGAVKPAAEALPGLVHHVADGQWGVAVRHGRVLDRDDLGLVGAGPWAVVDPGGVLLAVYEEHGGRKVKPVVVLNQPTGPPVEPVEDGHR